MSWHIGGSSCCFSGPWSWGRSPGGPWPLPTHPSALWQVEQCRPGWRSTPGKYGNYGYPNSGHSACEEENERLTESLRNKVTAIKSLSIESGHEVKHQNKLLAEMVSGYDFNFKKLDWIFSNLAWNNSKSCFCTIFTFFISPNPHE